MKQDEKGSKFKVYHSSFFVDLKNGKISEVEVVEREIKEEKKKPNV